MSAVVKPVCQQIRTWLEGNVGKGCLAPLTGQDHWALKAFAHALELYAISDGAGAMCAVEAMRACASAMQPGLRFLCKRLVPMMLDWSDEERVWGLVDPTGEL